jgi:hypothetical protein
LAGQQFRRMEMPNSGPMACPVDGATLVMSERQGIEIDYCPTCRGSGWARRTRQDYRAKRRCACPAAIGGPRAQSIFAATAGLTRLSRQAL